MNKINIENAILSTFLFINDFNDNPDDIYELDASLFTSHFRKRVAERLNAVEDNAYGFESFVIEEGVIGTKYEQDFIDILSQTPFGLGFSKKYHDKLKSDSLMEVAL